MRSANPTRPGWYSIPLAAILVLTGCSGDDGPSDPNNGGDGPDATVQVVNNAFNPSAANVPLNGTVRWQWNSGGVVHNVTFPGTDQESPDQPSGTYEQTFSTLGEFEYVCTIHAAQGMVGTVNVTATGGSGGGGGDGGGDPGYP